MYNHIHNVQAFDRQVWRQLRGEHVTAFLRLLKQKLAPHAIQVAVCVDGQQPEQAMKWTVDGGVRTAGNWSWSVAEWLRGGVVDELCLFNPPDEAVRRRLIEQSRQAGAGVVISAFMTRGALEPGVPRVMFLGREIECGHANEAWIDWPDEQVQAEPVTRLDEPDALARRRLLTGALKGKGTLTDAQLTQGVADPDLYVRRLALRTLAKSPRPATEPALIAALRDRETTVRCLAALALAELPGEGVVATLVDAALANPGLHQFAYRAVTDALKKRNSDNRLTAADKQELVARLGTTTPAGQALLLHYFTLVGAPPTPEVEERLSKLLVGSPSPEVRELSLVNLKSSFGATVTVRELVRQRLEEERDAAVQVRAAVAFAQMHARLPAADPLRTQALATLEQFFRRYGTGCERSDREWGWRLLGNTLLDCGAEGRQVLERLMGAPDDRELSDRAWRVLYLRQGDQFFPTTPAADAEAHRRHPWRKFTVEAEPGT
ncbi:MAG: HEAT repeat domain-containing protein [Planctomycetaceae bacterium]